MRTGPRRARAWCVAAAAFVAAGCGSSAEVAATREEAAAALSRGETAFANRNYAAAADDLAFGINSGGLNSDLYSAAAVKLAVCYAAQSNYDEAHALLDKLERGAPNMDEVFAARSFVFKKQGKAAESRAALAKARKANRTIKEFQ